MSLMVRPISIGNSKLSSSSITDSQSAWDSTTLYAVGDKVLGSTYPLHVYEAQSGGTVYTFSAGDVDYITDDEINLSGIGNAFALDDPIVFSSTGMLPAPLVAGTTYYYKDGATSSVNYFRVAATAGGARINLTNPGSGTHSMCLAAGANFGNDPETDDGTNWLDIGPSNKWAMFDTSNTTKSSAATSIAVTIAPGARFDCVALLGLEGASSVRVQTSNGYDETYSLTDTGFSDDWYAGTYAEAWYKNRFAVSDISPSGTGVTTTITVSGSGTVSIGTCIVGLSKDIGKAEYGASVGIDDYSLITRDSYGTTTITQRTYNDRGDFNLFLEVGKSDALTNLFTQYRATPALWLMAPDSSAWGWAPRGIIYGFASNFKCLLRYPSHEMFSLELSGLA